MQGNQRVHPRYDDGTDVEVMNNYENCHSKRYLERYSTPSFQVGRYEHLNNANPTRRKEDDLARGDREPNTPLRSSNEECSNRLFTVINDRGVEEKFNLPKRYEVLKI